MSLDRITPLPHPTVHTATPQATAAPAAKVGAASLHEHGESVRLMQALSAALASASKPLGQREVVCGQHTSSQPMSVQQLLQGIVNHTTTQLSTQLKNMRLQLRQHKSVKEMVKEQSDNPLQTHLLLSEIAHQAREEGNDAEAEQAQAQLDALDAEHGEEIKSGLSVTPALTRNVKDTDLRSGLRDIYYQHVIKNPSLVNFVDSVLHVCGEGHFVDGLRALQQALADDIANHAQLPQEGKLRSLMEGLGRTTQLNNMLYGCSDLASRTAAKHPEMPLTALMLMRQLIHLANLSMNVSETRKLTEKASGPSPTVQLAFINGLGFLLNQLPRSLWGNDSKSRENSFRNLTLLMRELGETERKALPDRSSPL